MTPFVISNDLIVLGMSFFDGGQTFDGQTIIDVDNAEALLVRKNGDGGDVFIVDTVNDIVRIGSGIATPGDGLDLEALVLTGDGARDSHAILFTAQSFGESSLTERDWKMFADISENKLAIDFRQNVAAYANVFQLGTLGEVFIGAGIGGSGSRVVLKLDQLARTGDGSTNSGILEWVGRSFETATPHTISWRQQVNLLDNLGDSEFTWRTGIDGSFGTTKMTLSDTGDLTVLGNILSPSSDGYSLLNEAATRTNPTINPVRQVAGDINTGIGGIGDGEFSMIVDSTERGRWATAGLTMFGQELLVVGRIRNSGNGQDQVQLTIEASTSPAQTENIVEIGAVPGGRVLVVTAAGATTLGEQLTSPIDVLVLDTPALVGDGQRDSHSVLLTGKGFETATPHDIDWRFFVDVTADDGTGSIWTLQTRIDAAGYVDQFTIEEGGAATFTPNVQGLNANSYAVLNEASSSTNPTLIPRRADLTTGIGGQDNEGAASLDLIVEGVRIGALNPTSVQWIANLFLINGTFFLNGTTDVAQMRVQGHSTQNAAIFTVEQSDGTDVFTVDNDGNAVLGGNLAVSGAGPHAIAGTPSGIIGLIISETFTSDGSATFASGVYITQTLVGFSGDTTSLTGTTFISAITTQTETESIANISQVEINEPFITDNLTGSIGSAQSLLITGAPTEGTQNWALKILSGEVKFGGDLFEIGTGGGDIDILFRGCSTFFMGTLASPEEIVFGLGSVGSVNSSIMTLANSAVKFRIRSQNGDFMQVQRTQANFALSSGSSVTVASLIPAGSFVVGITARVTTAVTGPTGFDIGDGIDVDRWGNSIAVALGTTVDITDFTAAELTLFPTANDIVITSDGVDFTDGVVRVVVHYFALSAPTS